MILIVEMLRKKKNTDSCRWCGCRSRRRGGSLTDRVLLLSSLLFLLPIMALAQFSYGTTGLLRMPTADMNRQGTVMFGFNHLNTDASEPHRIGYNTDSYYLNATLLPWVEVGYYMMLRSGTLKHMDHYISQDRSFHIKLRLWKEGHQLTWMPQVVIGVNDPLTHNNDNGDLGTSTTDGNSYLTRYYLALTKHYHMAGFADLGVHASAIYYNEREDETRGIRPAVGADLRFATAGNNLLQKALNGLSLMGEFDGRTFNVGGFYALWRDHILLYGELDKMQYPSAGIQIRFTVHQ